MKKIISKLLIFTLLINLIFTSIFNINTVNAIDADGTATINLSVSSEIEESNIVGKNFNLNINLENQNSSDGDAYKPGFIVVIPENVEFVSSSDLGTPTRTLIHNDGTKILFFKTEDILLKGSLNNYSIVLKSNNDVDLFTNKDIKVTAYAEDNIYGRGDVPSGSPSGTLPGGVDLAGSGSVGVDFPDSLDSTSALLLPYNSNQTKFIPYDIEKTEPGRMLIGNEYETTITIKGNELGDLKNLHITDLIPNNRKFVSFTQTSGVGNINVLYNQASPGETTLDLSNITVAQNSDLEIKYKTLALAYPIQSYTNSGANILLNTGSLIDDETASTNTANLLAEGTWNDGTNDINIVDPITRDFTTSLVYGQVGKSVSNQNPVIGDTVTYTISFTAAENVSYNTGTTFTDLLSDGLAYEAGSFSSTSTGIILDSNSTDANGDTTLVFLLNSSEISAGETISITYNALVDGNFEGAGNSTYESRKELVNTVDFDGIIKDSSNNEEWGYTDPSLIGDNINYNASSKVIGSDPTSTKNIVSIKLPDGTIYDSSNPLPAGEGIPAGSEVEFSLSMNFPNVDVIDAKVKDFLPLIMGPKEDVYDIKFHTSGLQNMDGTTLAINDNNGDGIADNNFGAGGALTLSNTGTWVTTEPANTVVFNLGDFQGKRTFSVLFKVKVLPTKPSGYSGEGTLPQKNVSLGLFNDGGGTQQVLALENIPFIFDAPAVEMEKRITSSQSDITAGENVDYELEITNTGGPVAYLEEIKDVIPENMNLVTGSFSARHKGSSTDLPNSNISQSGTGLTISFDSTGPHSRSQIPFDNTTTTTIEENIVIVKYSLVPTQNFIIKENDERKNEVSLDYYATPEVPSNGVNNFGPVESEASFTVGGPSIERTIINTSESGSTLNDLELGEEVEFETTITLPGGTYTDSEFREILNSRLEFLSGSVVSTGSGLTFENGTNFSGDTADFGKIVNNSGTPQTIVIRTKARVKDTATRTNNAGAIGRFTYSDEGLIKQKNTPVDVTVPNLNIVKTTSSNNVEVGDEINYTITITHSSNSNANAYDIVLKDVLPANLQYKTGSLSGNANFSGTEFDLFGASGLQLNSLELGNTETINIIAIVKESVEAGESLTNATSIDYTSLTGNNPNEKDDFTASDTKTINVKDVSISHEITSTSNPDTDNSKFNPNFPDASIGEEITYKINLDIPKLKINGYKVTQTLPAGIKFLTGSIITDGVDSHSNTSITINPDNTITFDFGNIDNLSGAGTGFVLETKVLVEDNANNTAGDIKNSNLELTYSPSNKTKTDNTPNFEIVEPSIDIEKDYTPNEGDSGDNIATEITITNNGSSKAYDISWQDLFPSATTISGLTNPNFDLEPGDSATFNFTTTIGATTNYGDILIGTGVVNSYKSINPLTASGRTYGSVEDTDYIIVKGGEDILKTLTTPDEATIGDKVTYELKVKVSETNTNNIRIIDKLPEGFAYANNYTFNLDPDLTYSGSTTPTMSGQYIIWDLQNVGNSSNNGNNDYITITYDSVVLDNASNNSGDSKLEDLKVNYNSGTTILTGTTVPVTIIEPNLSLNIITNYTYGDKVNYIFTITNSGDADAYDLDLTNVFDNAGISLDNGITIINDGLQTGLTQNGNNFTIDRLPINTGNPLQFSLTGTINSSVLNNTDIRLDGNLKYTSQDGTYTSLITNPENRERNGDGGVDDYNTDDDVTFRVLLPILEKSISVDKVEGDIGDYFEYTITLTNTGGVDLTGIRAEIDIPGEFEDFIILDDADPSTDNSVYGTGAKLDLSDISLAVGQTKTIRYRVKAKLDTPDLTDIDTIASISDSAEGALGGDLNKEVKIHAPVLETSISQSDDDEGKLLKDDIITNTAKIKNTGTSTGTNLNVEIDLGDNVDYQSGSLTYGSGTMIDTSTISYDPVTKKLTFTIISLGTSGEENFTFKTKVTGDPGSSITPTVKVEGDKDIESNSVSNTLIVGKKSSGGSISSGGNGGFTPTCSNSSLVCKGGVWKIKSGYTCTSPKVGKTCEMKDDEKDDKKDDEEIKDENKDNDEEEEKQEEIDLDELDEFLNYYKEKLKIVEKLREEQFKNGESDLRGLPKLLPQTGTPILKRVKRLNKNPRVDTSLPNKEVFRLAGSSNSDLSYWLQVLDKRDRNKDTYLVSPTNGLVIPINHMEKGTSDYENIISGRKIDENKYLKTGVAEYPGTSTNSYGEVGNKVIFGHSSYWKNDDGRYKTHFGKIIELDESEEVWIYKKTASGDYKRYRYFIEASYNTPASDVSVLKPGVGKNLTLITCTPIGGIAGRWIIKAKFIDEYLQELEYEVYFKSISFRNKEVIKKAIRKIAKSKNSKQVLYKLYNKVNYLLKKDKYKKVKNLLTYIKYSTALEIKKLR